MSMLHTPHKEIKEEKLTTIIQEVVSKGATDLEENQEAKSKITTAEPTGPDNITAVVTKSCNLDELIIRFTNKFLQHHKKPDQCLLAYTLPILNNRDLNRYLTQ